MQRPAMYIVKHLPAVFCLLFLPLTLTVNAQSTYKVLFLGNSYTYVNNLPQLVHDVALSAGDTLMFDSNAPGGYQLVDHYGNATSQSKIIAGGWDYVVLQGQSQEPIILTSQFNSGGAALSNLINQYNPCAVIMPYMTWGRKNGDASNCPVFPVMCTYQGMDTTLRNHYLDLTATLNGEVSPVSVVWNYIRQNHPAIELYQADESHPSAAGSYAAACCFYAAIFKKDPTLITYNFGLSASQASIIRSAAKTIVFDNLPEWDYKKMPVADIHYQIGTGVNEVLFNAPNHGVVQTYFWDFGDGANSSSPVSTHSYAADGTYTVSLTTTTCDLQGLHSSVDDTVIQFCSHTPTIYTSNPWLCQSDTLWTQPADSYQWFMYEDSLPETSQYLPYYYQYGSSGFSVMATTNGCSELSTVFTQTPDWSGYYFDIAGSPCTGDTVTFAVLHINSFLNGSETILWYKNDTLLSGMSNSDTLFITTDGKYECKVIDPTSDCPLDTTSYTIEYNCSASHTTEENNDFTWVLYPNPASETISIKMSAFTNNDRIEVYSVEGRLVRSVAVSSLVTNMGVGDLRSGLYYAHLKGRKQSALKFIKL